jgi:hypothetical protein
MGTEVLTALDMKSCIFWDITPCSALKANRHFGEKCRLILKMEVTCSCETSIEFRWIIRRYIQEERTFEVMLTFDLRNLLFLQSSQLWILDFVCFQFM